MGRHQRLGAALAMLTVAATAACAAQVGRSPAADDATTAPAGAAGAPIDPAPAVPAELAECPVTIPRQPGFRPPDPYPEAPPDERLVWFGNDELWTVLASDGTAVLSKMPLWWSVQFPGGAQESKPDVQVTWTRLDGDGRVVDGGDWTTNAYIPDMGWAMAAGTYPRRDGDDSAIFDEGCWRVEATYKGATLSYVFELPAAAA